MITTVCCWERRLRISNSEPHVFSGIPFRIPGAKAKILRPTCIFWELTMPLWMGTSSGFNIQSHLRTVLRGLAQPSCFAHG